MMKRLILCVTLGLSLSGCGIVDRFRQQPDPVASVPVADIDVEIVPPVETTALDGLTTGQTADNLDTTSAEEKTAALSTPTSSAERVLGTAVVALGSPAEKGLWLRTSLVTGPMKGRVVTASGASLVVDLLPGEGAALLSLAGFQALGLSLTDLPEVTLFSL